MKNPGSRLKPLVIIVCAVVVAAAAAVLEHHRTSSPRRTVTTAPTSHATSPTATVVPPSASPATTPGAPSSPPTPSPYRSASPSPPPKPTSQGSGLIDTPYGFQVPAGWNATPLSTGTSGSQAAHWTDPASPARIDYLVVSSPAVYSVDHSVNLGAIEAALPCQHLPPASFTYLPGRGPRYTCDPQNGLNVNGQVLLRPYPQGFRLLQVQMQPAQDPVAAQILAGFR
jgi:hypothetical protein